MAPIASAQLVELAAAVRAKMLANADNHKYCMLNASFSDAEKTRPLDVGYPGLKLTLGTKTQYSSVEGISFQINAPGASNLRSGLTVWITGTGGKPVAAVVEALATGILALANSSQASSHTVRL
ncbi:hypothetical protein PsYK624_120880 [Phanerochaete sordida]|uniref:Uncharacterized protein n=1 Tax=Phanerochaete sordida TaxID=48140 RepID=A0A9P3GIT1_9APHY|nr:hypothetical protein PsYK624_120880 [Phanerochaete sordida]